MIERRSQINTFCRYETAEFLKGEMKDAGLCAIPAERGQVENASICNNWQLQVWSQGSLR